MEISNGGQGAIASYKRNPATIPFERAYLH